MILELHEATLRHGNREVFANFSILAKPGERVALICGAANDGTLALQVFLGLHRLDDGWACLDGEPVLPEVAACFRKSMAYVPRDFAFGDMTVEAVARMLFGERVNRGVRYSADAVRQELEALGVATDCLSLPFGSLDAATAQRALIALTFVFRRPVALMDNPTLFQDDAGRALVAEYIASPRFDDVALLIATSDAALLNVCGKVVDLDNKNSTNEI